jgi:hypothetical protein
MICIASDSKSRHGKALILGTFKHSLSPESPIYPYLHNLQHMNFEVGDDDLMADKDYTHVFKRLQNLLLCVRGFKIHGAHIMQATIHSHLASNNLTTI